MEILGSTHYWVTRLIFQRALAFVYLMGFLIASQQFRPLLGEKGIFPVPAFLKRVQFWDAPSLFWWGHSDFSFAFWAGVGVVLALLALSGISDSMGLLFSMVIWGSLWVLYLSFVNVGQLFYGYGWESLLLETGFLAIFLGPKSVNPPVLVIWLLRWVLFRLMFGAGMIKWRADPCWKDLTCMVYHYETQPLPNPLSWYFHHLPLSIHKFAGAFTLFVELIVPFGYFGPQKVRAVAGILTLLFQFTLILSGNLSWLNYITLVLCLACFDDALYLRWFNLEAPSVLQHYTAHQGAVIGLTLLIAVLSIRPTRNLFSKGQMMNASFDSLHLVNTYGAFGSVTRERYEIVLEGTSDLIPDESARWKEYEFKGKPGRVDRMPPLVSPYHYKLDWQMWFAAMGSYWHSPWLQPFVVKLLKGDASMVSLLKENPFPGEPPKHIRAILYLYRFSTAEEKARTRQWWVRTRIDEYFAPLSLKPRV